ncbi:MAG TPA: methionyl-tRNA formyltransferase [Pyrinomonadaceae bacterium]|nr:methionyl-tRNA formyltransferase [Pyrinomonadaceae bacterium]
MRIVFMGTPLAAVPSLEQLLSDGHEIAAVWTQPDRPAGRGNRLRMPPVKEFALENDLHIFQPSKIKTAESLELFKSHDADIAVVVAYGRILPESFLQSFPLGAINIHFSLLPKYRGAAPVNWAIVNGESVTGITTMKMDAGLDTGDILLQRETEIDGEENAIDLMARLSFEGANLLSETLKNFENIKPAKQNDREASYAPVMVKEEGRINWESRAATIKNHVRGFQPFPTSFTTYKGKKLTVWKAEEITNYELRITNCEFGEILDAKGDEFVVACGGETVLKITEMQIEGKRRMSARDFLNGVKIQIGERFV